MIVVSYLTFLKRPVCWSAPKGGFLIFALCLFILFPFCFLLLFFTFPPFFFLPFHFFALLFYIFPFSVNVSYVNIFYFHMDIFFELYDFFLHFLKHLLKDRNFCL